MGKRFLKFISRYLVIIALFLVTIIPVVVVLISIQNIYADVESIPQNSVGIVFGASAKPNGEPSDMLRDRLDSAIELYESKKIKKIIVSGDNSTKKYNEPQVMYTYLVGKGVPKEDVLRDYAGFRTYDTCKRARTLWNVKKATLITQEYHLYRAVFTCNKLGIESIGYSATKYHYVGEDVYYIREVAAIYKSFIDLYIMTPKYVGGDFEVDLGNI